MKIKASGRSALMVAATVWLWWAGPLHAQETTAAAPATAAPQATYPNPLQQLFGIKPAPAAAEQPAAEPPGKPIALNRYRKTSARHSRQDRASRSHRHSRKAVTEDKTASDAKGAANRPETVANADNAAPWPAPQPAPVADIGTQSADAVAAADNAAPPASNAGSTSTRAETGVVASDELNEVDRAMAARSEPMPTLALASVHPPEPVTTGQAASAGDDHSSWERASLIGKIFIGFGGLLTLASALRMLIA